MAVPNLAARANAFIKHTILWQIIRNGEKNRGWRELSGELLQRIAVSQDCTDEDQSAICLEKIQDDEVVCGLECHQVFHSRCIEEWYSRGIRNCPICRGSVLNDILSVYCIITGGCSAHNCNGQSATSQAPHHFAPWICKWCFPSCCFRCMAEPSVAPFILCLLEAMADTQLVKYSIDSSFVGSKQA